MCNRMRQGLPRWLSGGLFILLVSACAGGQTDTDAPASDDAADEEVQPARSEAPPPLTGCYALTVDAEGWRVPAILELQPDSLDGWSGDRFADARTARSWATRDAAPQDAPFAYWRTVGEDSVEVGHPGALAGMTIRLGPTEGRALTGTILSFSDVISPDRQGPARDSASLRADPVACPGG